MPDLDLLTGAIAARLRLLPEVERLYPARPAAVDLVRTVGGLLDAVANDPTLVVRPIDGAYLVETSVGLTRAEPASRAGAAIARAVREACLEAGLPLDRVRIRISSVE